MLASLGVDQDGTGEPEAGTGSLEAGAGILRTQMQAGALEKTSQASVQRTNWVQTEGAQPGTAIADAPPQAPAAGLRARIQVAAGSAAWPDSTVPDAAENGKGSTRTGKPERAHTAETKKDSMAQSAASSPATGLAPLAIANLPLPIAAPVSGTVPARSVDAQPKNALHHELGSLPAGSTGNQAVEQSRTAASQKATPGGNGIRTASIGIESTDGSPVNGDQEQVSGAGKAGDQAGTAPAGSGSPDAIETPGQSHALRQITEQGSGGQTMPGADDQDRGAGAGRATAAQSPAPSSDTETAGAGDGKHASAEPVSRAARAGEASGPAEHGKQLEGSQSGGAAGDAATLGRDAAGVRGTISAAGGSAAGGSTAGGSAAAPSGSSTFAALDAGTDVGAPGWVHAGAHGAEAGFEDPALGWVGVRADVSGGAIHASLVPGSADAALALSGHLAGLSAHLAEQHTGVETLAVASPEAGRAGWGAGQGSQQGFSQGMNQGGFGQAGQNSGQGGYAQPEPGVDSAVPAVSASARTGPSTQPAGTVGAAEAGRQSGATISVVA